ncbi:hypothetical protein SJ05684_c33890 [Sinorhizobium sojae CCBAU 05684]|uniref:Uncharacterized protein n=1 Tax=Sinorhizobium sojae CCBAU 05684 TaxID=716928 RepID=A0A249PFV4_9HYPH|nr:hypothetical protein SJ05684_c33890 [Sinorhizobium sojae CCBAU 05684]
MADLLKPGHLPLLDIAGGGRLLATGRRACCIVSLNLD